MQIFWHGFSCIRIETTSPLTGETVSLVTDPYDAETGLRFPRTLAPALVALSHEEKERFPLEAFTNKPFIVSDPGEYEVQGIFAYALPLAGDDATKPSHLMYRFEVEGVSIGFLGGQRRSLSEEELAGLENIDVLLLPVGDQGKISVKQAIETISMIEPRMVVPLDHYVEGIKAELGTADAFCKELVCKRQDANKLKISKKDLPAEDLIVTVLQRA